MDAQTAAQHWFEESQDAWETMEALIKSNKRHYALFFLHLTLEKNIKGFYLAKLQKSAPFTHNLAQLAVESKIEISDKEKEQLAEISTFNIAARYDDYKYRLYEKATPEFVKNWVTIGDYLRKKFRQEAEKIWMTH